MLSDCDLNTEITISSSVSGDDDEDPEASFWRNASIVQEELNESLRKDIKEVKIEFFTQPAMYQCPPVSKVIPWQLFINKDYHITIKVL